MDITVPLMRFTTLEIEEDDEEDYQMNAEGIKGTEEKIVTLKYEHLPDFCYRCGILGHTKIFCLANEGRDVGRQFGPWLRAIIVRGSPREDRGRRSGEKSNFWSTRSAGSNGSTQGSDGPSWRKDALYIGMEGKTGGKESEEVTNPCKSNPESLSADNRGNELLLEGRKHAAEPSEKETKTMSEEEAQVMKTNKPLQATGVQRNKGENKNGQGTFKRISRTKSNTQQKQNYEREPELKKRNAEKMEIDGENEMTKKARMEVDEENLKVEKDGAGENPPLSSAGLHGQPGGTQ
jgi:hypothetical protein